MDLSCGLKDENGRSSASSQIGDVIVSRDHHMAKRPASDNALSKVLNVSNDKLKKHSKLYYWMLEHHAKLRAEFQKNGPQWPDRVRAMADAGLTDRTGKPASVKVAQNTWYAVCRAIDKERTNVTTGPASSTTTQPTAPKTATPVQPISEDVEDDEEEIEITMGDGTPRKVKIPKQR
jgi:hypothetical protein